ncbi:uncharacterized protein LOC142350688 [Convolutriloba macropyga]|uniref:uncharacterized protein LOC142350688 n=1 Tax=Convolutriloba macropyga TaxID=536237 RepID=UPI003F522D25
MSEGVDKENSSVPKKKQVLIQSSSRSAVDRRSTGKEDSSSDFLTRSKSDGSRGRDHVTDYVITNVTEASTRETSLPRRDSYEGMVAAGPSSHNQKSMGSLINKRALPTTHESLSFSKQNPSRISLSKEEETEPQAEADRELTETTHEVDLSGGVRRNSAVSGGSYYPNLFSSDNQSGSTLPSAAYANMNLSGYEEPEGLDPVWIKCPVCREANYTEVVKERKQKAFLVFVVLLVLLIWPFCLIPLCLKRCQEASHFCKGCGFQLSGKGEFALDKEGYNTFNRGRDRRRSSDVYNIRPQFRNENQDFKRANSFARPKAR